MTYLRESYAYPRRVTHYARNCVTHLPALTHLVCILNHAHCSPLAMIRLPWPAVVTWR